MRTRTMGLLSLYHPLSFRIYKINNSVRNGFVWSGALAILDSEFQDKRCMVGMGFVTQDSANMDIVVKGRFVFPNIEISYFCSENL